MLVHPRADPCDRTHVDRYMTLPANYCAGAEDTKAVEFGIRTAHRLT